MVLFYSMEIRVNEGQQQLLDGEQIGWLTTVRGDQPQASPVWYIYRDNLVWMRSRPDTRKLRNLQSSPRVAFNLQPENGGHVVTIEGRAEVMDEMPDEVRQPYLAKYAESIRADLNVDEEAFARDYSATVRISPTRVRGW